MKFLIAVDRWIIGQYERFAHWIQRLAGFDCYDLAALCCALIVGVIIGQDLLLFFKAAPRWWRAISLIAHSASGGFWVWIPSQLKVSREFAKLRLRHGVANPLKIMPSTICCRLILVWLVVVFAYPTPNAAARMLGMASYLYFLACDPLPPAESKVRMWIEALRLKTIPATN